MKFKHIILSRQEKSRLKKRLVIGIIFSFIISILVLIFKGYFYSGISFLISFVLYFVVIYFRNNLMASDRIKKMESVFPDFLQLVSSNLRAGMTIDKAMLLSSREEFAPLDKEILQTGKDIATGKTIESSLISMANRIGSDKIRKTILLIISGIKSGGNLAILLEETSSNLREREFVEKKASSNVLMYVIFIFLAVAFFAPALFSLSNILVEILTKLLGGMPEVQASVSLPFTLSKINVSVKFIKYFSIFFILALDILASLVLGLVGKGEEKQGLKYLPLILVFSLATFFLVKIFLNNFLKGFF